MTTIEDKIKLFSKIIYDEIQQQYSREFENFEKEKVKRLEVENRSINEKKAAVIRETVKRANLSASEIVSREKLNSQQQILALKESLIRELFEILINKMNNFVESQEYDTVLFKQVEEIFNTLDSGEYVLYLTERDVQKYGEKLLQMAWGLKKFSIWLQTADKGIIGGVILEEKNKRFRIDNTLFTKLQQQKHFIGLKLTECLK